MTTASENSGILTFLRVENYINPIRGFNSESIVDYAIGSILGIASKLPAANWAHIPRPLLRNGLFVLEASMPAWVVLLRFAPSNVTSGDYRIQHRRPANTVTGGIEAVVPLSTDTQDSWPTEIRHCQLAYQVITFPKQRGDRLMWLIGLSGYEQVDDSEID